MLRLSPSLVLPVFAFRAAMIFPTYLGGVCPRFVHFARPRSGVNTLVLRRQLEPGFVYTIAIVDNSSFRSLIALSFDPDRYSERIHIVSSEPCSDERYLQREPPCDVASHWCRTGSAAYE